MTSVVVVCLLRFVVFDDTTSLVNKLEICSVERGICPIAESIMTDTVI